jgi:BioD-like phosphotransacetylase family protein
VLEGGSTELAGLVLTGGYRPRPRDLEAIRDERLFAMLVETDTYEAASRVHDLLVKTHPADREKIELTRQLISEHLEIDHILSRFAEAGSSAASDRTKDEPLPVRTIRNLGTRIPRLPGRR